MSQPAPTQTLLKAHSTTQKNLFRVTDERRNMYLAISPGTCSRNRAVQTILIQLKLFFKIAGRVYNPATNEAHDFRDADGELDRDVELFDII